MFIICKTISSQKIFDITSGKVYPVYFGLVNTIIFIFLRLLWTIKNHMAGSYYFFPITEVEMRFAGGYI